MKNKKEISALLSLVDDPDEEVFEIVSEKILHYGSSVLPELEYLLDITPDPKIHHRLERLIHRLNYRELRKDFIEWNNSGHHDLMLGSLLVSKYYAHDLEAGPTIQEIEKLRKNIWLELNSYLTPLEQIHIVSGMLYNYYGLKGTELNYDDPDSFLLNKLLEKQTGNQLSLGILYLILCELLDIPVKAIPIPHQFVLAYIKKTTETKKQKSQILFFIDPVSGLAFSFKELEEYFNQKSISFQEKYFIPLKNKQIIRRLLVELKKCFKYHEKNFYRDGLDELISIMNI
ncbi:MAG: transglutaminase-like domain-containing protein [Chitinophagaceae bacterium]|nr:transglutaminase-like domain-containing protein [Chitinophagaceae bacterium]